jgi:ribonucleotide monophosphatase NagD (HAD superfamily)
MIGDSLDHDIIGARNNGIESVWIANGVHSAEMGVREGSSLLTDVNVLHKMYEKYGVTPTHTIACLG